MGTSHISLTTIDIDGDIQTFEDLGFSLRFVEKNLENNFQKDPFLNRFEPLHSLAVLAGRSGIDVELVQHHKENNGCKNHSPIIHFEDASVSLIEYRVHRLETSISFWESFMGFRIVDSDDEQIDLEKSSMFPQWASKIRLVRSDKVEDKPKLDVEGATSFAFLTTSLAKDLQRASDDLSLFCSDLFEMTVNGRKMRIGMIEGPSNEIIELIQIDNET